ncbi:MAG: zf-HC2 domain-containing protein [Candidatus Acidiferrum sp.]
MTCELSQTRLHAYLDNELDAMGAAEFERHLETCPDCERQLAVSEKLRNALSQAQLYERAPASLRSKIQSSLPKLLAATPSSSSTSSTPWQWLALAAALLLAAILGWRQWDGANHPAYQQTLAAAVVDAHLRSMQPGHLADVVSTDQHTVKPWFDGRLTFAPPVRDFADAGFPLIGGRLDVIDGRTVAALVYGRRKHIVNVFVAKAEPAVSWSGSGGIQGYHWTAWQKDGLSFCAVSDAAAVDLDQLKQLFLTP